MRLSSRAKSDAVTLADGIKGESVSAHALESGGGGAIEGEVAGGAHDADVVEPTAFIESELNQHAEALSGVVGIYEGRAEITQEAGGKT
jgi:hypothetical protein